MAETTYSRLANGLFVGRCGDGPAILFLHGYGWDSSSWEPQFAYFGATHTAIAFDYRGHGRSTRPGKGYGWPAFVNDIDAVLNSQGVDRAVVVGLSFGGVLGATYTIERPDRVAGLVLADTSLDGGSGVESQKFGLHRLNALIESGVEPNVERSLRAGYSEAFLARNPAFAARFATRYRRNSTEGLMALMVMLVSQPNNRDRASEIQVPAAIIAGELDAGISEGACERMQALLPGSDITIIPGAGHISNEEDPAAFNAAVDRLLDRAGWR